MRSPDQRTAYTVTSCAACDGSTALVIAPPRYICLGCGETGTVGAGGWTNQPDRRPDVALAVVLKGMADASPSIAEFRSLCKLRVLSRESKLRGIRGGRG